MATNSKEKVFGTYELFELILNKLSLPSLLLSQRVCKQWHHHLAKSLPLRRKLHLEPDHDVTRALDSSLLPKGFAFHGHEDDYLLLDQTSRYSMLGTLEAWTVRDTDPDACASWRNMYLCQPPPDAIEIDHECAGQTFYPRGVTILKPEEEVCGVTLGMLIDAISHFDHCVWDYVKIEFAMQCITEREIIRGHDAGPSAVYQECELQGVRRRGDRYWIIRLGMEPDQGEPSHFDFLPGLFD